MYISMTWRTMKVCIVRVTLSGPEKKRKKKVDNKFTRQPFFSSDTLPQRDLLAAGIKCYRSKISGRGKKRPALERKRREPP
jgi:hypothetical protein